MTGGEGREGGGEGNEKRKKKMELGQNQEWSILLVEIKRRFLNENEKYKHKGNVPKGL